MWNVACTNSITKHPAFGWELVKNSYNIIWFNGPQMPDSVVLEIVPDADDAEEDVEDYSSEEDCNDIDMD